MKRAMVAAALFGLVGPLAAQQSTGAMAMKPPAGKEASITGTVIDVSCKFGNGLAGPDHRMCSQVCADNGLPLAILGSDGKLYVPATPDMPGKNQNPKLKEFAEQKVLVKGKVFAAAGAQVIQIESVAASK